jgi:Uma2 family endonuclease
MNPPALEWETILVEKEEDVVYPETDGEPMAETDFQRNPLIYAVKALEFHFADNPHVYVSGNLLIYYEKGNPKKCVAPDVFVVMGVPNYERPIYKIWEERKGPDVVIEITSHSTRQRDERDKPLLYAWLGVQEYFQYDPTGDYLTPALRGRRLNRGYYDLLPLIKRPRGLLVLPSHVLNLELHLDGKQLRLYDPVNNRYLLSYEESEIERRQALAATKIEAEARRQAETEWLTEVTARKHEAEARRRAEAQARTEVEARRQAEAQARTAAEAQRRAEAEWLTEVTARKHEAEARRQAEAQARTAAEAQRQAEEAQRQAEARAQEVEEQLRQLRAMIHKTGSE